MSSSSAVRNIAGSMRPNFSSGDFALDESLARFVSKQMPGTGKAPLIKKLDQTSVVPLSKAKKIGDGSAREYVIRSSTELKLLVANLSMHLPENLRKWILVSIDRIYDEDAWYEEDALISNKSFNSMLSFLCFVNVSKLPSLGVADSGEVMCSWDINDHRLALFVQNNPKMVKLKYFPLLNPAAAKLFSGNLVDAGKWLSDHNICL